MPRVVHKTGWPCVAKTDYGPTADYPDVLAIVKGEEGIVWTEENGMAQVTISRSSPLRFGWVPLDVIQLGTTAITSNIRVEKLFADPSQVKISQISQSTSPLSTTLHGILHQLRILAPTTAQLDFMIKNCKDIIDNVEASNSLVNGILRGIPQSLAPSLTAGTFTLQDLLNSEQVSATSTSGIYAMLYQLPENKTYLYVGMSIHMARRDQEHRNATADPNNTTSHYKVAKQALRRKMVILTKLPGDQALLPCAENLFILLLETYVPWVFSISPEAAEDPTWLGAAAQAQTLSAIASGTFRQSGWRGATSRLGLRGVNTTSPLGEWLRGEKVVWVMKEVPGEVIELRRPPVRIQNAKGATGTLNIFSNVNVPVQIKKLPDLHAGTAVHLIIEILLRGDYHPASFARLPVLGAYEDWKDCSRLAVRMEWQTPSGWCSTYLQRIKTTNKNLEAPGAYIDTSAMLAAFKGIAYTNPATWRKSIRPLRVISVQWSHLDQTLQLKERLENTVMAEPRRLSLRENEEELKRQGLNVTTTKPPDVLGFYSRKYCDTCLLVGRPPSPEKLD